MKYSEKIFPYFLYISGILMVVVALTVGSYYLKKYDIWDKEIFWLKETLPKFHNKLIPDSLVFYLNKKGEIQQKNWLERKNRLDEELSISETRLTMFRKELTDSSSPFFLEARQRFTEEAGKNDELKRQKDKFKISSGKKDFWQKIFLYLMITVIFLLADKVLIITSRKLINPANALGNWTLTYIIFVFSIFIVLMITYILSSIISENKSWVGSTSFFVCPETWIVERWELLGLIMILAIPLTRLWRLTRRQLIPSITKEGLYEPDGKCGIGNYINFLDLWTNISFVFFAIITVIGLRPAIDAQITVDEIYLLPVLMSFIITIAFALRMIINGIRLRENYLFIIQKTFKTLQEKVNDKIADDPTINFIGDRWWKIPVTLVTMMGTTWVILKWSGISSLIEDVVK